MLGTMKAGGLEVPVDSVRLVAGNIEFSGEIASTWRRPIRASGGPVRVALYGSDGQQVAPFVDWLVEIPAIARGGTYRLTLTLRPEADHRGEAWAALHRLTQELPPRRRAITG
jgi:hypothetical protein